MIKKTALLFIVLFGSLSFSKSLLIKGNYVNFDNKPFTKVWKVKIEENKIFFSDNAELKAVLFLKKGKIEKIVEYKKVAGKVKEFVISKPEHIKLELKANYFPFEFALNYLNGKQLKNSGRFTLLEAREK